MTFQLNITTLSTMQITFNEAKDALNKSNHGLSLSEAEKLEWDDALIWQDTRRDYGEVRMIALGQLVNFYIVWFMLTEKRDEE